MGLFDGTRHEITATDLSAVLKQGINESPGNGFDSMRACLPVWRFQLGDLGRGIAWQVNRDLTRLSSNSIIEGRRASGQRVTTQGARVVGYLQRPAYSASANSPVCQMCGVSCMAYVALCTSGMQIQMVLRLVGFKKSSHSLIGFLRSFPSLPIPPQPRPDFCSSTD